MKIRLTKKGKIALFVILGIIVLGSGGYLVWRVTQQDTVAPTDSDAGGGGDGGGCCLASYVNGNWMCPTGTWYGRVVNCWNTRVAVDYQSDIFINDVDDCLGDTTCRNKLAACDSVATYCYDKGTVNSCGDNHYCLTSSKSEAATCLECENKTIEEDECYAGSDCPACEYPNVGFCVSGECKCLIWSTTGMPQPCEDTGDTYTCIATCPTGKVECSSSSEEGCTEVRKDCTCSVCKNKSYDTIYCKDAPVDENICQGKNTLETPSGTYSYCQKDIAARVEATDPDDIDNISVTLNSTTLEECTTNPTETCYQTNEVEGNTRIIVNINEYECLDAGEYTISMDWTDGLGNEGTECAYTASFTIDEPPIEASCGDGILGNTSGEQCELGDPTGYSCTWDTCDQDTCTCPSTNPDWSITKVGVESCIEDEARATYTITVRNIGDAQGSIDRVVDVLDTKVLEGYIYNISGDGEYASGQITWDLEGDDETFDVDESMTFTYYIQVPSDDFGTYDNTVTAYPGEGDSFSADEEVDLDCDIPEEEEETIPQTGLFDSSLAKIVAGIVLMVVGFSWNKINYSVKEYVSDSRIKRFENKVAKKKQYMI